MAEIFPNMMKTIIHISKNFNELLPQKKNKEKNISSQHRTKRQ